MMQFPRRTTMLAGVSLALAALATTGCQSPTISRDPTTISETRTTGVVEGRPTFQMPISIPMVEVVMVPFALQSTKGLFEDSDPFTRGGIHAPAAYATRSMPSSPSGNEVRWHNVLFRDLRTGEEWPLLSERGIIGRWQMFGRVAKPSDTWIVNALVFIAVIEDTNRDGSMDDRDARVAILTDATGRNARVVSPRDGQVWNVSDGGWLDVMHLQVAHDTNRNGLFDFNDIAQPYSVWLNEGMARPTVSPDLQRKAESLLK